MGKHRYYTIYLTTNNINNNYYVGKHKTNNLNDGYMGSGTLLRHAIKKHGRENFTTEILMLCSSNKEMNAIEKLVVDSYMLMDSQCYNIALGGNPYRVRRQRKRHTKWKEK